MMFSILAIIFSTEPPIKPYAQLDADLSAWKKSLNRAIPEKFYGEELEAFERWIVEPTCALMRASRAKIISPLHMRVYLERYYTHMQLALGDCDERVAAQLSPHLPYDLIEKTLETISSARDLYSSDRRALEYKRCGAIIDALGASSAVVNLLPTHSDEQ